MDFSFLNFDLLSVGVAVAGMAILGFVVLFSDSKNFSYKVFFLLAISSSVWGVLNYLSYQVTSALIGLWLLKSVFFVGVISSFFIFLFAEIFPDNKIQSKTILKWIIIPLTLVTLVLVLTPLVLVKVLQINAKGQILQVEQGKGTLVYALTIFLLNIGTILALVKKVRKADKDFKKPLFIILLGALLMVGLIVAFNFVLPAAFNNTRYIPLGALFLLPFVLFTSYSVLKHKIFNVKVASVAILIFILSVANIVEVIASNNLLILVLRFSVFILVLSVGVLLIKSVLREIKQKEELQILAAELEKVNGELKELDKARADFITIASHQLRTPPATIKWYVAAILSGDFGALLPDVKAQLEKVQATNNSQISLIDDMLNASRIERGKMEFLFEEVEVEPMAKMTYDQLMPLASMKGIKLIYNPPKTPLPKVMADIEKLRQVMNNFIDNAIKYTDKGTITAELFQEGDNIRFQVTDNGMGIKPDLAPHLFSKYARGQDSVTHAQGLGLGLYVCKMVVDQHHGKIWAESPGEGKGSTFIFTIPIHNNLKATTLVDLKMDGVK